MSVSAWVQTTGYLVPTLPASRAAGNLLLTGVTLNDAGTLLPTSVDGWGNPLYTYTGGVRIGLYGRIATADSADTFVGSFSTTTKRHGSMACFTGDIISNINSIVHAGNYRSTSANSSEMNAGSLTVTSNDRLIITVARRQHTTTVVSLGNAFVAGVSSLNWHRDSQSMLSAWCYWQQTTATDIVNDNIGWDILPGDSVAYSTHSIMVALNPESATGAVYPETIGSTILPTDGFIKSVSAGLAWSAVPTIASETGSSYTVNATRGATSVLYGVAVPRSAAPPSVAQIKAGQDAAAQPACAVNTSTSGTGAVSLTLTPSINPPFPFYDLHFALSNGTLDSDRQSILGHMLDPTTGHLFKAISSISPTGPLNGTMAAPGDVWKTHRYTQATSYELTLLESADFQIAAAGDTDRQEFSQWLYDVSAQQWEGPGTVYVNNAPPEPPTADGVYPTGLVLEQNSTITPIDMATVVTDPEADALTVTKLTGAWPTGLSMGGGPNYTLSGTPTEYGSWQVQLRWTDTLDESYEETFAVITGPKLPNVVGMTVAQAQAALALASLTITYDQAYHETVPAGDVISMSPAALTVVPYDQVVVLTISLGVEP